ncbi:MAG: toll/interleukin-1 receptor domain-containing protein [Bacteroidota bacterium]|nr:toll/interleukin-1 receptor domain-containing protein [Bacteroidota bacterium]
MATLKEYFDTDFTHDLNASKLFTFIAPNGTTKTEVPVRVHLDFDANAKYLSCFIPDTINPIAIFWILIKDIEKIIAISDAAEVQAGLPGEKRITSKELKFAGRFFLYSEKDIDALVLEEAQKTVTGQGIFLQFRGPEFALERSKIERPFAFICHDSRDKEDIARPIAIELTKSNCPVWYDEYSLKVGDKLRESIEKGIKECKKCVLILSPNFLSKGGWTKTEFDSIFTRELIEDTDLILPVWAGISSKEVYEFSPSLANRVGIKFDLGVEEVVRKLRDSITK